MKTFLKNTISRFFWRQYGQPRGLFGKYIGKGMAENNLIDAAWTLDLLDIEPEDRILEIGFGPGISTKIAAEKATKGFVAGIDHSETMVRAAKKLNASYIKAGKMEISSGSVACISYPEDSFDKALSLHSIYFWPSPIEGLQELRRVLKVNGILAITIQPKDAWNELQRNGIVSGALYSGSEIVEMLIGTGFRNVRVELSKNQEKSNLECIIGQK